MTGGYILAVDQGTSATKAFVFGRDGGVVAAASRELASTYPRPGFVEQDPEAIYRSTIDAVRACVEDLRGRGGDPASLESCGISNQRETFLLWGNDGAPLCNAVSWQCGRSAPICQRLRAAGQEQDVAARTGLLLVPYFSGSKLLWLLENDPAISKAVKAGSAWFGTVDTWLLSRLTGGKVYATDHTNASRTLLFNIDSLSWDAEILRRWGLEGLRLPSCHSSVHAYGETDFEGALPAPLRIDAMIGDSHAATFGEGCFAPSETKATMGTGSSVMMNVGTRRRPCGNGIVSTVCFSLPAEVHYALEGIIISCGSTVTWLRDQLGLFASSADTESLARAVPDSGGVFVVPAFSGLGAPRWRMDAKASIVGLTFANSRNHIVRAALESIPFQIADVIGEIEALSGFRPRVLRVDGGMTANSFVVQGIADLLGVPVARGDAEASARGAALLAGLGAGLYRGIDELSRLPRVERLVRPGPDNDGVKRRYKEWRTILSNLP